MTTTEQTLPPHMSHFDWSPEETAAIEAYASEAVRNALATQASTERQLPTGWRKVGMLQERQDGAQRLIPEGAVSTQDASWGFRTAPVYERIYGWQGGLSNKELLAEWRKKIPGLNPSDSDLATFALGIEAGAMLPSPVPATQAPAPETKD